MNLPRFQLTVWFGIFTAALGLGLCSTSVHAADTDDPTALIKQLASDDFDARKNAATKLIAMGETARTALEQAANTADLELRQAASTVLQKIDKSTITVFAFDRDGKPAAGAESEVKLFSSSAAQGINWNDSRNENVTLKPDGSAKLPDQSPGMIGVQFNWKKWSPARDSMAYWNLFIDRGNTPLIMTLTRGGTVSVLVQDADGKPLKDAQVLFYSVRKFENELLDMQLTCSENWDRSMLSANTDATGTAQYEGLADGAYQCIVKASDFRSGLGASFRIHEGETLELAPVKLSPRNSGKIQLTLKKSDGTPLKKTRVNVTAEYTFEGPRAQELQRMFRQLRTQMNMQRNGDWPETDDDGKITLEDQRPGKYRVSVSNAGETSFEPIDLDVVAGQTADTGALKVVNGGTIKGKLVDAKAKGMQYCTIYAIPEEESIDYDDGEPVMDWRFMYQQFNGRSAQQTQADGNFEIKNLRPGRYALSIQTRTGQPMIVYGIVVEAGKTATVPDATVPTPPGMVTGGKSTTLKGTILMPDGKPAVGASIGMVSGFSRWGRNTDEKGVFEFNVGDQWQPTRLVIKAAECKPQSVDLTAAGTKLTDLTIQLEKQEYGDLRMKIVDDTGKPLSGVSVRPAASKIARQVYYYRQFQNDLKAVSNREGIARFTGLATGPRGFQFEKDGYYVAGEVVVTVLPSKESELSVTMKKGYSLEGRIELPPGADQAHSAVFLNDAKSRVISIDKDGKFQVNGLAPGDYNFTPISPGLVPQGNKRASVKSDGKVTFDTDQSEVKLKMGKAAGAAVSLGAEFAGYHASLVPKGSWDPQVTQDKIVWAQPGNSGVDATGRAEFWGTGLSEFDLVLNPPQVPYYNYRYYNSGTKKAHATLVGGTVKTQLINEIGEMKALKATELKVDAPNGRVSGRLVCEPNVGMANVNYGSLNLQIIGPKGYASVAYAYPSEFHNQGQRQPIVLGTLPTGMKASNDFGNFQIQGLPPGEYKIYASLTPYNYNYSSNGAVSYTTKSSKGTTSANATPIATCTIKPGEHFNLGTIKYTLPASAVSEMKSMGEAQLDAEPEDRLQLFQP